MDEIEPALKVAQGAVEQLSLPLQRRLAEWVLRRVTARSDTSVAWLQHLSASRQSRLATLLEQNGEGRISARERVELRRLVAEVDRLMLANAQALARAARPELFDAAGRPLLRRIREAVVHPRRSISPGARARRSS